MILIGRYLSPFVRRVGATLHHFGMEFEHRPIRAGGADQDEIRKSLETITGANWVGTVDHIVEKLSALREQGFRHFNILHLAADTVAERLEQMQLFAEEIMPQVRT